MFALETFDAVDLTEESIHSFQAEALGLGPEQQYDSQSQYVDANEDLVRVVPDTENMTGQVWLIQSTVICWPACEMLAPLSRKWARKMSDAQEPRAPPYAYF